MDQSFRQDAGSTLQDPAVTAAIKVVIDRLQTELQVIEKTGFISYFLIVGDFIRKGREMGVACVARGSAAGSLVTYLLEIANVDPIRYGLLIERFLNPERISPPDIDIDFADDRRADVIGYVREKYGEDSVAQIITFGTMGAKSVVRDVGRVMGLSYGECDRLAKMIPFDLKMSLRRRSSNRRNSSRLSLRVSRRRVHAIMRAHGLVLTRDSEPGEPARGHVVVPEPNRRLATDLTTVWTRRDGVVALVPTIDCGDRTAVIEVTKDQHGPVVLASVEAKLIAAFGAPENVPDGIELRTDHGPQYTGADCEALCRHWRLAHTFAPVGRPTGNAVVERFIRTLKEELIWLRDWDSADELRAAIAAWLHHYLHHRPHQALKWQTPIERRAERLAAPVALAA